MLGRHPNRDAKSSAGCMSLEFSWEAVAGDLDWRVLEGYMTYEISCSVTRRGWTGEEHVASVKYLLCVEPSCMQHMDRNSFYWRRKMLVGDASSPIYGYTPSQ